MGKVILAFVAGAIVGSGLTIGIAVTVWFSGVLEDPEGMAIRCSYPEKAVVGQPFALEVTVENERADEPIRVSSIDIAQGLLDGLVVEASDPPHASAMTLPLEQGCSYGYDEEIPTGGSRTFVFTMRPAATGMAHGDIDVCEGDRFKTTVAQIYIRPADDADGP
ncbi:MAG: hypothetical protein ACOCX4_06835 [Planctomycetota bacterium]